MQQGLPTLAVVLPVFFWAGYHYHKDRRLPEPVGNLLLCLILGVLAAALSKGMYIALEPFGLRMDAVALADADGFGLLVYALLAIGPIEEFAKMLPFLIVVLRFHAFDESLDGIIYVSFIALGYAAVENYYYLDYLGTVEAIARGFVAPVVHIVFATIWAYPVTRACLQHRALLKPAASGLLIAAGLHGLYDFAVLRYPATAMPLAAMMIASIWVWRLRVMQRLSTDAQPGTKQPD